MNDLLKMIMSQLGDDTVDTMSQQVQADKSSTQKAIQTAIPILVNALARNSSTSEGANSLLNALNKDHDGSILDNLSGYLTNPEAANGSGILKHVLGNNQSKVENYLSKTSGISLSSAGNLLKTLAPIIMGFLGKQNTTFGSGGGIIDILQSVLGKGQSSSTQKDQLIFNQLLDQDNDGSITDDLLGMGTSIFKKFFKK